MIKKIFILSVLAAFLLTAGAVAELSKTAPMTQQNIIKGDEPLPDVEVYPYVPGTSTDSPGLQVGITYYDYQTNGSSGNRVAICDDGSIYFDWMYLNGWPYPQVPRHVYHNWMDANGVLNPNEIDGQVNVDAGAGYTNLDIYSGTQGCFAYHSSGGSSPTYATVSIDNEISGMGIFDHYNPPDELFPQTPDSPGRCYWPYMCVDRNDNIHVTMTENTTLRMQRMAYTGSTDGGATWSTLQFVDTVMVISSVVDASPVSDRVVIAYSKTTDTSTQWYNDIYYVISDDGTSWDFRYGRNNITNYTTDDDSLFAYTDLDVLFDYNDNIHVVWTDQWVTDEGIYYRTNLKHWDEESDEIETIFHHPDSLWTTIEGAWNRSISKMNLGVDTDNNLFCTFTYFDTSDISEGGFGNGEIYMVCKPYGGSWDTSLYNLTNSASPGCFPGECDSDHWSTLADVVDENLHVLYINDKDAGGIVQTEGTATENPVLYLTYPNPYASSVDENTNRPENFSLNQNYPNPFNASTVISFSLKEAAPVTVDIFDLTGAKVTTLVNEHMNAGSHEVVWNASDVASGVYFYKLTAGGVSETKQAVMIK
ncbi:MAG: T9SS type A sorting domain-containing protein [candidate division Zixibacteria bacterium]|nr:T9SS type A sorting domain-containing protein [candidate division Zixibacteria bacterium]